MLEPMHEAIVDAGVSMPPPPICGIAVGLNMFSLLHLVATIECDSDLFQHWYSHRPLAPIEGVWSIFQAKRKIEVL